MMNGRYLRQNPDSTRHRYSPESRRRAVVSGGSLDKEVRGKQVGMVPTCATCQGYCTVETNTVHAFRPEKNHKLKMEEYHLVTNEFKDQYDPPSIHEFLKSPP